MRSLVLTAALALIAPLASAADMSPAPAIQATEPLAKARKLIAAKDWTGAIKALQAVPREGDADWHNLLGYSLRRQATPDLANAERHYLEALRIAPDHKGANEYLGQLYVMKGDLAAARQRLGVLEKLCPSGCEERSDLQAAIDKAPAK